MPTAEASVPRVEMVATVRNRRGIIASMEPFDGDVGRLNLVRVEYKDDQLPLSEELLWELEPRKQLLEPTELPQVRSGDPMPIDEFDALVRATRWSAICPYLDPDGEGLLDRLPIASPFHGAVQVEDYQLVPLLKALQMPRVSMLIADDVGIGKTIEAGLILSELLLRRRIQRVLILTPASLRRSTSRFPRNRLVPDQPLSYRLLSERTTWRHAGADAQPAHNHRIIRSIAGRSILDSRSMCETPAYGDARHAIAPRTIPGTGLRRGYRERAMPTWARLAPAGTIHTSGRNKRAAVTDTWFQLG